MMLPFAFLVITVWQRRRTRYGAADDDGWSTSEEGWDNEPWRTFGICGFARDAAGNHGAGANTGRARPLPRRHGHDLPQLPHADGTERSADGQSAVGRIALQ